MNMATDQTSNAQYLNRNAEPRDITTTLVMINKSDVDAYRDDWLRSTPSTLVADKSLHSHVCINSYVSAHNHGYGFCYVVHIRHSTFQYVYTQIIDPRKHA